MIAADYWKERYATAENLEHHSNQSLQISRDFLREARQRKPFAEALSLDHIIEIGCGTGELAHLVRSTYNTDVYYATDFSKTAVQAAQKRFISVNFWQFDILKDKPFKKFDLAISSNCLEHFSHPHAVIEKMFALAPKIILLVPYKQPVTDGYETEGGAGHAYEFDEGTFTPYTTEDFFTFQTHGWQHSSVGEIPLQLAVLISQ